MLRQEWQAPLAPEAVRAIEGLLLHHRARVEYAVHFWHPAKALAAGGDGDSRQGSKLLDEFVLPLAELSRGHRSEASFRSSLEAILHLEVEHVQEQKVATASATFRYLKVEPFLAEDRMDVQTAVAGSVGFLRTASEIGLYF
jgi:hypothetical protein